MLAVGLVLAATALACARLRGGGATDVVFPRHDSAAAQFDYAADLDQTTLIGRSPDKRDVRLRQIIAAYQMVVDHFPDDQIYTPLAMAGIAYCYFRMGDYRQTIRIFKNIEERYPCYPFLHAQAEWRMGRSEELLGNGRKAKWHYKRCIDTFRHNRNDHIQTFVKLCEQYYYPPSVPGRPGR